MENVFGAQILSKAEMVFDAELARTKLSADHKFVAEIRSLAGVFEITIGAIRINLRVNDHPIPDELVDRGDALEDKGREEAIEHVNFASAGLVTWPDAHPGKLLYIITLCQVMDSLLEVLGASAVLWNGSQALVPAGQFRRETRRWRADIMEVPLFLLFRIIHTSGRWGTARSAEDCALWVFTPSSDGRSSSRRGMSQLAC